MPSGYPPSVFVSSTCYDLSQIRLNLREFIESLGYVAVISENHAFPINPQANNVENCLRGVRDRADLFILIVGGRYGTQLNDGLSITNHEYLEAHSKGIPIYVFIAKSILHTLPVWQSNPTADFSNIVDTSKLFTFVDHLRESAGHWVFSFEHAKEIVTTLRAQWALLFTEALQDRAQLRSMPLSLELENLPASCLRVLLEKRSGWEYRFFAAVLRFEIDQYSSLKRDIEYELRLGVVKRLCNVIDVLGWLQERLSEIQMLTESVHSLVQSALQEALGPCGQPGDPELLAYVARRIGKIYGRLLEWTHAFTSISTDERLERLISLNKTFSHKIAISLEMFPENINSKIAEADAARAKGEKFRGEVNLILDLPPNEELTTELQRVRELIEAGQFR